MHLFKSARLLTQVTSSSSLLWLNSPVRFLSQLRAAERKPRGQNVFKNNGVLKVGEAAEKGLGKEKEEEEGEVEEGAEEEAEEEELSAAEGFEGKSGTQSPSELRQAELKSFFLPVDPEKANKARLIFTQPPKFLGSFSNIDDISKFVKDGLPEVAFTGRSNCGKSSLINSLTSQKKLVRTSKTPGHTSALNFFQIGQDFILVDMPGYGFGCRQTWLDLILTYAKTRKTLKRVCLLTDSGPGLKAVDKEKMKKFDSQGTPYQVVITKLDRRGKEAQDVIEATTKYVDKYTGSCFPEVIPVSSAKGTNIPALRISILEKLGIPL